MMERYERQMKYEKLGREGQEKLLASKVLIVGMGALGCMCASLLARAGVGYIRMVDGDTVSLGNLHRQILFTEEDARKGLPKVVAAASHLREANSEIILDPIPSFLEASNAEELFRDIDLVLDAVDNLQTRYLINRYCTKQQIPWIYAGVNGAEGMTAVFLPGEPCFHCFAGGGEGVAFDGTRHGVLNTLPAIMASYEVTEAIKILTGSSDVRKGLFYIDAWNNVSEILKLTNDPACPVCGRKQK